MLGTGDIVEQGADGGKYSEEMTCTATG